MLPDPVTGSPQTTRRGARLRVVLAVAAAAMFFQAPAAQVAAAAATYDPPFGKVIVHAADWLGGKGQDVYSNGSANYLCNPKDLPAGETCDSKVDGKYVGIKWQCVELAQRVWIANGWAAASFGVDAAGIWAWAHRPAINLTTSDNGKLSATTISPGDMVVWTSKIGEHGHVAVVDTVSGSSVAVKEQNWGFDHQTGSATYTLKGGWLSGHGLTDSSADAANPYIAGIVHHPETPATKLAPGGVDLVFAVDTTGSMGPYLDGAIAAASSLVNQVMAGGNARIALVEYRDLYSDCAIDGFASRVDLQFSNDTTAILSAIGLLATSDGLGCDEPESVYSGLMSAIALPWRPGVTKSIVLMGDAPPHDPEPVTGYTLGSVTAAANALDPASVYSIDIHSGGGSSFEGLSSETGGSHTVVSSPDEAVSAIASSITTINRMPVAVAGGPYAGRAGDTVVFDASASSSPSAHIVKYEWDFNGDGTFESTTDSPIASYTYDAPYDGQVTLRVTDDEAAPLSAISTAAVSIGPARLATRLVYDGTTAGERNLPALVSATLTESAGAVPVPNALVTFTLNGVETCTSVTDASGRAACAVAPTEGAGSYTVDAAFNGSDSYLVSAAQGKYAVSSTLPIAPIAFAALGGVALLLLLIGLALAWKRRVRRGPGAVGGSTWPAS